ncbi:thioesterase family protein [Xenophilus arseniciresistens]|uniref:Thioesterase family protein n=1 Tax=Xenophilus arseniciresistens TaxID=1283306 RepID=A0AAE3NCI2_9BURK|nr:thioesterase family protein [Xenophilus arseniciresistens]MDA7417822.1 thioesterase family protein [Xenophilus arseniciresistens]
MTQEVHIFDRALALEHSDTQSGLFAGAASQDYWNMVGPFGGTTAALALRAVLQHPDLLGTPIALTVNYASAIGPGPLEVLAIPVRTNRSTQHWRMEVRQSGEDGRMQVNTTATAVTAARRETWSGHDLPMPQVPPPAQVERFDMGPKGVAWFNKYEMRPVRGAIPASWDGAEAPSESMLWLRDAQPRALDFCSLAAMSDLFYPRVWLRRAKPVPAGTVSITTYFHADAAQLQEAGTGYLLGRAQGQQFFNGFFDQAAQLWSEAGRLLATSNQIVYFKE